MDLDGKTVFVSGASTGIGAEAARQLARCGARVVLAARSTDRLEAVAAGIRAEGGVAWPVTLDVTRDASVAAAVRDVLERLGAIDVLVNNAGNGGELAFFMDSDPDVTRRMVDVHLLGTERMMRAVLPSMLERGSGRIVNVVSTVAYVPMPGAAAYSSAKAAVIALSRALAGELVDTPVEIVLFSPPHTQTEAGPAWPLDLPRQFTPEHAAAALVATLRADRREWLAGGNGSLVWLSRLAPGLALGIMRKLGVAATRKAAMAVAR